MHQSLALIKISLTLRECQSESFRNLLISTIKPKAKKMLFAYLMIKMLLRDFRGNWTCVFEGCLVDSLGIWSDPHVGLSIVTVFWCFMIMLSSRLIREEYSCHKSWLLFGWVAYFVYMGCHLFLVLWGNLTLLCVVLSAF